MTDQTTTNTLNKDVEAKKGYWTDDESRGISLYVTATGEDTARISLSSEYWYRVQHFDLSDSSVEDAWKVIKALMKECGRSLVLHAAPIAPVTTTPEDEGENESEIEEEPDAVEPAPVHYCAPYLSVKQVDQIYYLLKHALTTAKVNFVISHTIRFDTSCGVAAPPKRRRRRKKKGPAKAQWQTVANQR